MKLIERYEHFEHFRENFITNTKFDKSKKVNVFILAYVNLTT